MNPKEQHRPVGPEAIALALAAISALTSVRASAEPGPPRRRSREALNTSRRDKEQTYLPPMLDHLIKRGRWVAPPAVLEPVP